MIRALVKGALLAAFATAACVASAAGYPLRVEAVADEDGVWQVIAHNRGGSAVVVQLTLTNQKNVRQAGVNKNGPKVLEPGAKEVLIEAVPVEPTEQVGFEWDVKWVFGRGTGKGTHDGLYRPPFPGDLTFDTNNSASEHPQRELHAVDILMPAGTPIIAARSGVVMDVGGEENGDRVADGLKPLYITDKDVARMGPYVRILHDDGTWAEYSGLKEGSVKVTPGIKVEAGSKIGLSGERAGSEPHITFAVMKATGGFGQPESLPIKMEMAGRGVMTVIAGNAMGASVSVVPGANLVKADPLVIAKVEKGKDREGAGEMTIRDRLVKDWTLQFAAAGAALAVILGLLGRWMKRKKGAATWREWLANRKSGGQAESEAVEESKEADAESERFAAARLKGDLRPDAGRLIAEWELGVYSAIGIALNQGYVVMAKVSLNRLFPRPTEWLNFPDTHAQMRGESIDFAIVRLRDTKIVAAIDIERHTVQMEWTEMIMAFRRELLQNAGIKHLVVSTEVGPDELRKRLGSAMALETGLGAGPVMKAA